MIFLFICSAAQGHKSLRSSVKLNENSTIVAPKCKLVLVPAASEQQQKKY